MKKYLPIVGIAIILVIVLVVVVVNNLQSQSANYQPAPSNTQQFNLRPINNNQ